MEMLSYWERCGYDAETERRLDEIIICANIAGMAFDRSALQCALTAFESERLSKILHRLRYSPLYTTQDFAVAMSVLVLALMLLVVALR